MPRMPMDELRELADRAPGTVRFVDRFVTDPEIPAFMRRADLVVLPYRNIEQSGVLYTALAFGRPLVLSAVGGFPEIARARRRAAGAAGGSRGAGRGARASCSPTPAPRAPLAAARRARGRTTYSWDRIGGADDGPLPRAA